MQGRQFEGLDSVEVLFQKHGTSHLKSKEMQDIFFNNTKQPKAAVQFMIFEVIYDVIFCWLLVCDLERRNQIQTQNEPLHFVTFTSLRV